MDTEDPDKTRKGGDRVSQTMNDIKKLGFGLMRLPQKDGKIDIVQVKQMVDRFLAEGFTYFDTAWAYAGSEDAIRQALVERYTRDRFLLATKNAARVDSSCRFLLPFHTGGARRASDRTSGDGICTASDQLC